jgi:hypothetical protein
MRDPNVSLRKAFRQIKTSPGENVQNPDCNLIIRDEPRVVKRKLRGRPIFEGFRDMHGRRGP